MVFDCYAQIEHVSKAMTLEPGDVILTGTPGGVGAAMKPPRYLNAGDVVAVTIERIGEIRHTVVPEAR
jgi:2-keto-4-pentenoate hydratase/2-oxohepta-3-ene-1,7-dioic acid hydratase in catechol pathway